MFPGWMVLSEMKAVVLLRFFLLLGGGMLISGGKDSRLGIVGQFRWGLALALFFGGLFAHSLRAQEAVNLDGSFERLALGEHAEVLKDPAGDWSFEEVRAGDLARAFKPLGKPILSVGFTRSVYWLRFALRNPGQETQSWLLDFPFRTMDEVSLYRPVDGGEYAVSSVGDILPLSRREVKHDHFLFQLEVPAEEEQVYYVRLDSHGGAMVAPLELIRPVAFLESVKSEHALWGFTFGLLGMLVAYNLFQFLSLRERGYLFYALAMAFVAIAYLILNGWGNYYFWGNWSLPVNNWLPFCWLFALYFLVQYFRSLLDTGKFLPRSDRVLRFLSYGILGCFLLFPWLPYGVRIQAANLGILVGLATGVTASLLRFRQRYEPALYPLLGMFAMMLSAGVNILRISYGEAPAGVLDVYSVAGFWVEALMLSFALSSRYKLLRAEKEKIQAEKLQIQSTFVAELERADELKDHFLANTSHELRTPLHGIIGLCEAMNRQGDALALADHRRNVELISHNARRLSHLVNDILDFSRLKSQDLRLNHRDFDVRGSIRLACTLCGISLLQKPVKLVQEVPDEPLWVHADEERLQQVLFNLVGNAIKFTHEGEVRVCAEWQDKGVRIEVADTGIGIAEEKREDIFKPFVQADGSITREYGGTGLGLAISRQLVELHGSSLALDSTLGRGSSFSFVLPAGSGAAEGLERTEPEALSIDSAWASTTPSETVALIPQDAPLILVVDDEPLNVELLRSQLTRERYRIRSAGDGVEALRVMEEETPDLVLLDLMMPRMNGYEVCRRIRQSQTMAELPVIILTAKGQMEDLVRGLREGANDYLTKPFYHEELLARIRSQLAQREAVEVIRENERLATIVQEIRQTEASLKQSQRRLSRILEESREPLLVVNGEGRITFCSQALATALGRPVETIVQSFLPDHFLGAGPEVLRSWPPEESAWAETTFPQKIRLRTGEAGEWSASLWGVELELEEGAWLFSFSAHGEIEAARSVQWAQAVTRNRERLQKTMRIFEALPSALAHSKPELLEELAAIDRALEHLGQHVPTNEEARPFEQQLVQVMNDAIACWELTTKKTIIDLAEESGIWAVNIDDGRLRARSMERYLEVSRLPQRPRWRNVLRTGHYVLTHASGPSSTKERLEQSLHTLIQSAHQRNLTLPPFSAEG